MHTLVEMSGGSGAHVPAFLAKLWKLVDDTATNDLIYWSESGNSFIIRNQAKFSRELLPLYYKHNNMASFVRQLNMYGFHKVVSVEQGGLKLEKDEMEFAHPFFLRGNEPSLELIKRKIPVPKHDESRLRPSDNLQKVLIDVKQMKGRQESMDSKLLTMKRENEALWRELASLRQKHANQTTILSKILQFLVGVMSSRSHRIGFKRRMPLMLGAEEKKGRREEAGSSQSAVIHDVTELFENTIGTESTESPGVSIEEAPEEQTYYIQGVNGPIEVRLGGEEKGESKETETPSETPSETATSSSMVPAVSRTQLQIPKKEDLDAHLDDMQVGLDNLRDLLKSDEYKVDTLGWSNHDPVGQLFGEGDNFNLDFSKLAETPAEGQEVVSYNPSLFELTEDDSHFFDDTSNMFLDDELQSMLTTDKEKLRKLQEEQEKHK